MTREPLPPPESGAATPAADDRAAAAPRRWVAWSLGLALVVGAASVWRVSAQQSAERRLLVEAADDGGRQVQTVRPRPAGGPPGVTLPATLRAAQEAAVVARTGGYVRRWTKDIGDRVRRGELLVELDAPEAEHELKQARAARDQVRSRLQLARQQAQRYASLADRDAVSRQEIEERAAAARQSQAELAAADANVQRLEALAALRRVSAPFDGVIVRRNVETGALITAASGRELYLVADLASLRIDLGVPQAWAAEVQVGQTVRVSWPERPALRLEGRIERAAPSVDPVTRSRQVVVAIANSEQRLLAGSYVDVTLGGRREAAGAAPAASAVSAAPVGASAPASGRRSAGPWRLPGGVLQFRAEGPRVAVVDGDRVALRNVRVGRDYGREVEILDGIGADDRVVLNPPDTLVDGERVLAREAPPPAAGAAAPTVRAGSAPAVAAVPAPSASR